MLGQKDNLTDMCRVVRKLPVDRLQHGVRLSANCDRARHILRLKRLNCSQHASPTFFPPRHNILASARATHLKLAIAKAVWLFSIAGKEVGEARTHIPRQML